MCKTTYDTLKEIDLQRLTKLGVISPTTFQNFAIYETYKLKSVCCSKREAVVHTSIMYNGLSLSYIYKVINFMEKCS